VTATVAPTDEAMRKLNKTYEHHEYEGAGHGFVRQQSGEANIDAAKKGWERAVSFLKGNLE
jgi:dienelactone hydrolase